MLTTLTPEQVAQLPAIRDHWLAMGLSTAPADRRAAEDGVRHAYRAANLEPPSIFVWLSSPLAGAVGAAQLKQVGDQVGDQVGAQVGDQVWDQVWAQVREAGYGQHDANWIGFYDAFRRFGIDVSPLRGLTTITSHAGWWWPFRGLCVLTERPDRLSRDAEGRLHSADGMALRYRDQWGIYAWHGVRVNEALIMRPDTLTPHQILQERNAEVRRVMFARYGEERFMRDSGVLPIHSDDCGDLYRVDVPDDEPLVMVRVLNSTAEPDGARKPYWLRVPPDMTQARAAVAWTFGLTARQYAPVAES